MIFAALFKALSQIGDARFRRVLFLGVGGSLALLFAFYLGLVGLIQYFIGPELTLPLIGTITWASSALSVGSLFLMLLLSMFLMVPVASAISSMFLDQIAEAVEDRHYPELPKVAGLGLWDSVKDGLGFLGVIVIANLLALVLYLLFAPVAPLIFWGLNGFLLGREYFTLAAARRLGLQEAKALRRRHAATIWAAGVVMAIPLTVPLLNLVVPIIGAACFTHLFHMLRARHQPVAA